MKIFITGATGGLGSALSSVLANSSNELVLVDLDQSKLNLLGETLKSKCQNVKLFAGDLSDPSFISQLQNYIKETKIDILINNAAIAHKLEPIKELTELDLDLAYKINLKAPFMLIKSALEVMNNSGQIINIASRANIYGYIGMGVYGATKSALTSIGSTVALENAQLKSISIILGRTNTPMQQNLRGTEEASTAQTPEFVASVISEVVNNSIPIQNGQYLLIDFGKYKVMDELDIADLHAHMN